MYRHDFFFATISNKYWYVFELHLVNVTNIHGLTDGSMVTHLRGTCYSHDKVLGWRERIIIHINLMVTCQIDIYFFSIQSGIEVWLCGNS